MKTLGLLLSLTLLHLVLHTSEGSGGTGILNVGCCPHVDRTIFPLKIVTQAKMSPDYCPIKALIVQIRATKQACIDPTLPWSKKCLAHIQKMKAVNGTGP